MDAVVFGRGVLFGTIASQLVILYLYRYESYSRTVFVIYAVLLLLLLTGTRASFRLLAEFVHRRQASGRRCLIYGTAGASLATIREAFGTDVSLTIVGFIDDDPLRQNISVGGYPVLGDYGRLRRMIRAGEVDCVIVNAALLDADRLVDLEGVCAGQGVELLRLHLYLKRLSEVS
jgi:UDP-GlcNAc:undecaprenyl-phosphate GlcNAc-1-phosphate transferase